MTDLVVGAFSPSVLLRVARRTGALDAAGLRVDERPVPSSPAQFAALRDGALDAALTSPDNVLAYRYLPDNPLGATLDVRILAAVDRGLGLGLYARPGLDGVEALRGATLGVDVPVSGFAFALYEILAGAGLRRDRDYRLVDLGATPRRLRALLGGDCDATILNAGNDLRAEAAGYPCLRRVVDVAAPYLGTVLAVAGEPGQAALALAGALRTTIDEILAGALQDAAVEEAEQALRLPTRLARRYVRRLADPREGLVPGAEVDAASLATIVDLRRRHGGRGASGPTGATAGGTGGGPAGDPLDAALDGRDALLPTPGRRRAG